MQTLRSNTRLVYFANYIRDEDILVNGKKTGEKLKVYTYPRLIRANISEVSGRWQSSVTASGIGIVEPFGVSTPYSKTMVLPLNDYGITEESIMWYSVNPESVESVTAPSVICEDDNGTEVRIAPNDIRVVKVAESLNSVSYGLKEVK